MSQVNARASWILPLYRAPLRTIRYVQNASDYHAIIRIDPTEVALRDLRPLQVERLRRSEAPASSAATTEGLVDWARSRASQHLIDSCLRRIVGDRH